MRSKASRSVFGVGLTVFVGLFLWKSPVGTTLIHYSYDGLFLFPARTITNEVTVVIMDNESYEALHQKRGQQWDRGLHAQLLDKLAVDNCASVVLDVYLGWGPDRQKDQALARAIKRHHEIALRAGATNYTETDFSSLQPILPTKIFLSAASNTWGISHLTPDSDGIVRRHWPFPSPAKYPSLAETVARTAGAAISEAPHERWLRYYGSEPSWQRISYKDALKEPPKFFHEQIVFVGVDPKATAPVNSGHKYLTPYTHWTHQALAGTELLVTETLNLLKRESLRRWHHMEMLVLLLCGLVAGAILPRLTFLRACIGALLAAALVLTFALMLTALTNYWFPWLLVVVGQLPTALVLSFANRRLNEADRTVSKDKSSSRKPAPEIPGYRLVEPPFGHGAYGEVWLARNKNGDWRAIKVVSLEKFENDRGPYDREYEGVSRYREICDKHPGLLRVEFVSEKFPTHFYYVMELGDALDSGWEKSPAKYKPCDLNAVRSLVPNRRLSVDECLRIGMAMCDTLDFIHRSGLTHRDIKPQNILFVNGQPKLADLGLITDIRHLNHERTAVGTPGYMPPAPEMPGTPAADIYALGMVLYVISTGRSPTLFPELSETLLGDKDPTEFFLLNTVVLKACQPDPKDRYGSAADMRSALQQLKSKPAAT